MTQKYESASQQRILKILLLLGGHEVNGLSPSQVSKSLNISPSNVTHDLANLKIAGVAEPILDTNRWRLTPRIPQIGLAMLREVDKSAKWIEEVKQRYTREPK